MKDRSKARRVTASMATASTAPPMAASTAPTDHQEIEVLPPHHRSGDIHGVGGHRQPEVFRQGVDQRHMAAAGIEKDQVAPLDQGRRTRRQRPLGLDIFAQPRRQRSDGQRQCAAIDAPAKPIGGQRPEIAPDGILGYAELGGQLNGRHRLPLGEAGGDQITAGKRQFIGHIAL